MNGKYRSPAKYLAVRAQRAVLRTMISSLVKWEPLAAPDPGYTVVIGCKSEIASMLGVNLRLLAAQEAANRREVIVVFDKPREVLGGGLEESLRALVPGMPLRCVYYDQRQSRTADRIAWGWVYSWMSWSKAIACVRTRYVLLHDFDALLLDGGVIERRYEEIVRRGHQYLGVSNYAGNGVEPGDGLVTTFEMMLDAQFVRRHFKPIDLFNHVRRYKGRTVDFDTLLYAQSRHGASSVLAIPEEGMVHPSQMICQYTDHMNRRGYKPPVANNLLLIPYYMYVSGDTAAFERQGAALRVARGKTVEVLGKDADCSALSVEHAAWIGKQMGRVERALYGEVRPEVAAYIRSIQEMVGGSAQGAPRAVAAAS